MVPTLYLFDHFDGRLGTLPAVGAVTHAEELGGEDTVEFVCLAAPEKGERMVAKTASEALTAVLAHTRWTVGDVGAGAAGMPALPRERARGGPLVARLREPELLVLRGLRSRRSREALEPAGMREMRHAFCPCDGFTEINLSGFAAEELEDAFFCFASRSNLVTIWADADWELPSGRTGLGAFYACESLVGGAGTSCAFGCRDAEYTRIDGG